MSKASDWRNRGFFGFLFLYFNQVKNRWSAIGGIVARNGFLFLYFNQVKNRWAAIGGIVALNGFFFILGVLYVVIDTVYSAIWKNWKVFPKNPPPKTKSLFVFLPGPEACSYWWKKFFFRPMKTQEKKYTEIKSNFFHLLSENSREKKNVVFTNVMCLKM